MEKACLVKSTIGTVNSSVSTLSGEVWNLLQQLKQEVTQELLAEGPLCQHEPDDVGEGDAAACDNREIEWLRRSKLEENLRDITDAQDRLLDGNYGKCVECGKQISAARLAVNPVVSLCVRCQGIREIETAFHTL